MKEKIWTGCIVFACGVATGIIPYAHQQANQWRGYNGYGGECLLPLIPLLIHFMVKGTRELWNELDDENNEKG